MIKMICKQSSMIYILKKYILSEISWLSNAFFAHQCIRLLMTIIIKNNLLVMRMSMGFINS